MIASHSVKNGVCAIALSCPAAATILPMASRTVGCVVSISESEPPSYGASSDGKSTLSSWGSLHDSLGDSFDEIGDIMCAPGMLATDGDGGGDAYAPEFDGELR